MGYRIPVPVMLVCACVLPLHSQLTAQESDGLEFRARRAVTPPVIDGILNDEVWSGDPLPIDTWVSYNPLRGEPAGHRTDVWIAYDDRAIYIAFRVFDSEPDRIRTTISRRDTA